jgi:hypothetical protein
VVLLLNVQVAEMHMEGNYANHYTTNAKTHVEIYLFFYFFGGTGV